MDYEEECCICLNEFQKETKKLLHVDMNYAFFVLIEWLFQNVHYVEIL